MTCTTEDGKPKNQITPEVTHICGFSDGTFRELNKELELSVEEKKN